MTRLTFMRLAQFLVMGAMGICGVSHADDYTAADSQWRTDSQGCRVWDSELSDNRTFTWSGRCVGGKVSGKRLLKWLTNGQETSRFQGEYQNGKAGGQGTLSTSEGSSYTGDWEEGEISGNGTFRWANGSSYAGDWLQGVRDGRGTLTLMKGDPAIESFEQSDLKGRWQGNRYIVQGLWLEDEFVAECDSEAECLAAQDELDRAEAEENAEPKL